MTPEKQFNPAELAALDAVLTSEKWRETGGLDEWTMYGELAMEVAAVAIAAEREACAKMLDDLAREARTARDNHRVLDNPELEATLAMRHNARASAFTFVADAIRARGE